MNCRVIGQSESFIFRNKPEKMQLLLLLLQMVNMDIITLLTTSVLFLGSKFIR